nr:uncharacterized protein LOC129480118 [Symphalangus syndactylus]
MSLNLKTAQSSPVLPKHLFHVSSPRTLRATEGARAAAHPPGSTRRGPRLAGAPSPSLPCSQHSAGRSSLILPARRAGRDPTLGPRGPPAPARWPGPARRRETSATPSPGPAPPSLRPARSRADPSIRRGPRAPQVLQAHSPRETSHHPGSLDAYRAAGSEGLAALWRRRGRSRNVAERPSMVPGPPESVVRFFLWFCFLLPPTRKASCDPRDLKSCNRPCVWSRLLIPNSSLSNLETAYFLQILRFLRAWYFFTKSAYLIITKKLLQDGSGYTPFIGKEPRLREEICSVHRVLLLSHPGLAQSSDKLTSVFPHSLGNSSASWLPMLLLHAEDFRIGNSSLTVGRKCY